MKSLIIISFIGLFGHFTIEPYTGIELVIAEKNSGEMVMFAEISLFSQDSLVASSQTDFDGKCRFGDLSEGTYDIEVKYLGLETIRKSVSVSTGEVTKIILEMSDEGAVLDCVEVVSYKLPILEMDNTTSGQVLDEVVTQPYLVARAKNIFKKKKKSRTESLPTKDISVLAGVLAGVKSSSKNSSNIVIRGSRSDATHYDIGGVRLSTPKLVMETPKRRNCKVLNPDLRLPAQELEYDVNEEEINLRNDDYLESTNNKQASGQLTAAEWNDLTNWNDWITLTDDGVYTEMIDYWQLPVENRISVLVINEQNFPIANCVVTLVTENEVELWQGITDNTGKVELWEGEADAQDAKLVVTYMNDSYVFPVELNSKRRDMTVQLPVECSSHSAMDIMFVVDATGSMSDEISYLKAELADVVRQVGVVGEELELRVGAVFYKDKWDDYLTAVSDLNVDVSWTLSFMENQSTGGGGDFPEAMDAGLEKALAQKWNPAALNRIIFLLLDAPPHHYPEVLKKLKRQTREAAAQGIKLIPITASGIDRETEYLMKQMAMLTNGTYVFLTDDSGIGETHLTHAIPDYDVEKLNELLVRLLGGYAQVSCCTMPLESVALVEKGRQNDLTIDLYPNPAMEQVTIELSEAVDKLVIMTSTGRRVMQLDRAVQGKNSMEVSELIAGSYYLSVIHKGVVVKTVAFMVVS